MCKKAGRRGPTRLFPSLPALLALAVLTLAAASAQAANRPPSARAGPDVVVAINTVVQLDGRATADPDGDTLAYSWSRLSGPTIPPLSGGSTALASFTPTATGTYRYMLTVSDPGSAVSTDEVAVLVQTTADGADLVVRSVSFSPLSTASNHKFHGSATIQNTGNRSVSQTFSVGFFLSTVPTGSPGSLPVAGSSGPITSLATGATLVIDAPNLQLPPGVAPGSYFLIASADTGLTVSELSENNNESPSALKLAVSANASPIATAQAQGTPPFIVQDGQFRTILLDGRASSDADGDPLSYLWQQTGGPSVFPTSITSATTPFSTNQAGLFVFSLQVKDDFGGVATTSLAVRTVANSKPVISIPAQQILTSTDGAVVRATLDASQTTDPEGDPIAYSWVQTNVPPIGLVGSNTAVATFATNRTTSFKFTLTASDPRGGIAQQNTVVTIVPNFSPTASAGPSRIATITDGRPATVQLDGRGSRDPDGDRLFYSWTQLSVPAVTLTAPNGPTPSFTSATPAAYAFRLQVDDRRGGVSTQDVTVTLQSNTSPTAIVGPPQSTGGNLGTTVVVTLDGSPSRDPGADPLSYSWVQTGGPTISLFNPTSARPSFSTTKPATYGFLLTVSDNRGGTSTAPASATVTFADLKPVAVTYPTTAGAGSSLGGTVTVTNVSSQPLVAAFETAVLLSRDDLLDAGDARIATLTYPGIDALRSATQSWTASLPLAFPTGAYRVLVQVDPSRKLLQQSQTNDLLVAGPVLQVLTPPDLHVTAVLASASAKVGTTVNLSGTIENAGQQPLTTSFKAAILLLTTTQAQALLATGEAPTDAKRLSLLGFGPLGSRQATSFSTGARIPHGVAPGFYAIGIAIDPDRQLTQELNRVNNGAVPGSSTQILPLPDLGVKTLAAPALVTPGVAFTIDLTLQNRGGLAVSSPFTYWYFLSKDPAPAATGTFLGAQLASAAIAAGGTAHIADARTLPQSTVAGTYFLRVVLAPLGEVEEEDDTNNLGVTASSVAVAPLPELVLISATLPSQLSVRSNASIPVRVQNVGNAAAAGFSVKAWLSADRILDGSDRSIGSVSGPSLAASASRSEILTASLDLSTPLGPAFLLVDLESPNATPQVQEGPPGNLRAAAVTIVDPSRGPRAAFSYGHASPVPAGTLTITASFDEAIVTVPTIAIDQPGTSDLPATTMTGSGTLFTFRYPVGVDNGGAFRDGSATVTIANAFDKDHNPSEPATNGVFVIDTKPPAFASVSPAAGSPSVETGIVSGRISDASSIASLTFSVNGGESVPLSVLSGGTFSGSYRLTGDANDVLLTAVDAAGNRSTVTLRLLLDSDGDGMSNIYERAHGFNPFDSGDRDGDPDLDGLTNYQESIRGTDPRNPDTDGDGVPDGVEVNRGTDPLTRGNDPPLANAGTDASQGPGLVVLDGSRSRDPQGGTLGYTWTQLSGPAVTLANSATANPQFAARASGQYVLRLTVKSSAGLTDSRDVQVDVTNVAPAADAGPQQVTAPGKLVTLDGTRSSDANGDQLSYGWSQVSGPAVATLSSTTTARPTFVPPAAGAYVFALVVRDGSQPGATPSTVRVLAINPSSGFSAPNADAGPDQVVPAGTRVELDGHESADPDSNATLSYRWKLVQGPAPVNLVEVVGFAFQTTFQANAPGTYVFSLAVVDTAHGNLASAPAFTTVVVNPAANHVPRADAGADRTARIGDVVMLDGTASSDTDAADRLTYRWSQVSGSTAALPVTTGAVIPIAPVVAGDYTFGLNVSDGQSTSPTATVKVRVSPDGRNRPPVALPRVNGLDGSTQEIRFRIPDPSVLTVPLSGAGSSDPDGDALTYHWRQVSGPVVELSGAETASASFSPRISRVYTFALEVSDGIFRSEATIPIVIDSTSNQVPRASIKGAAAGPISVAVGSSVSLDGSASADPDSPSTLLSFAWVQTGGPFVDLIGQSTTALTVTPRVKGTYRFRLFVDDSADRSVGKDVVVQAGPPPPPPPAPAPPPASRTAAAGSGSGGMSCRLGHGGGPSALDLLVLAMMALPWTTRRKP
ncbi:MAG: hypothetical protein HY303_02080 [Candidatus Wallbacteria bacterium]|nr:hypothetical protein [Candidatus Wallbacteria bacterium]